MDDRARRISVNGNPLRMKTLPYILNESSDNQKNHQTNQQKDRPSIVFNQSRHKWRDKKWRIELRTRYLIRSTGKPQDDRKIPMITDRSG